MSYADATKLRAFRGTQPQDFDLQDEADPDQALNDLLDEWADHVKDLIDDAAGTDFLADAGGDLAQVPNAVKSVALRALSNYVTIAQQAREQTWVQLGEWRVGVERFDQVLTPSLLKDLPGASGTDSFRMLVVSGD